MGMGRPELSRCKRVSHVGPSAHLEDRQVGPANVNASLGPGRVASPRAIFF
jgi:hypothetical protein